MTTGPAIPPGSAGAPTEDESTYIRIAPRGNRLVPDDVLPAWMRPLVSAVDGSRLPPKVTWAGGRAPRASRRSAVLILFGDGASGPDVLLTARASTLRSHAGQPAFPGGGIDPGEDAIAAALREGEEETGLDPAGVQPVALLPEIYLRPSGHIVRPVLAYWRKPGPVHAVDPRETAAVARVPIEDLADPANRGRARHHSGFVGPAFLVAGLLVWGFTANILDAVLDLGGWTRPWDLEVYYDLEPS